MDNQEILKELYSAIAHSNVKILKEIIKKNPDVLHVESPTGTWLHVASRRNNIEIVKFLVNEGIDINKKAGIANEMPINGAASEGHIEIVRYLLKLGAIFDESDPAKNPLFAAIHNGHLEIVMLLVENGINVNIEYKDLDPISFGERLGRKEIVSYLKKVSLKKKKMNPNKKEPSVDFSGEDPGMQKAIKLAQSEFHVFVEELIKESKRIVPAMEECIVKYAFQSENKNIEMEHMFLTNIHYDGEKIIGYLASEPEYITSFKEGDLVIIEQQRVSDWLYIIDGVTYGGFTFKYMWEQFSKSEKDLYRDQPPFCWINGDE